MLLEQNPEKKAEVAEVHSSYVRFSVLRWSIHSCFHILLVGFAFDTQKIRFVSCRLKAYATCKSLLPMAFCSLCMPSIPVIFNGWTAVIFAPSDIYVKEVYFIALYGFLFCFIVAWFCWLPVVPLWPCYLTFQLAALQTTVS